MPHYTPDRIYSPHYIMTYYLFQIYKRNLAFMSTCLISLLIYLNTVRLKKVYCIKADAVINKI